MNENTVKGTVVFNVDDLWEDNITDSTTGEVATLEEVVASLRELMTDFSDDISSQSLTYDEDDGQCDFFFSTDDFFNENDFEYEMENLLDRFSGAFKMCSVNIIDESGVAYDLVFS